MSFKKALVFGSNGLLGQAFLKQLQIFDIEPIGVARSNATYCIDLLKMDNLSKIIIESNADLVINCAAIVSINECEKDPLKAKKINSDLVNVIARSCSKYGKKFIHISTDHFYINDKKLLHKETDELKIVNQYAMTKRIGELNALRFDDTLIVRTNITGLRGLNSKPTFFEWLYSSLKSKSEISLFTDFYTSTISAELLAKYSIIASNLGLKGLINIASSECISKKDFALLLAKNLSMKFEFFKDSSVSELETRRANSLGLDCSKAEQMLKIKMPNADEVIKNLIKSLNNDS